MAVLRLCTQLIYLVDDATWLPGVTGTGCFLGLKRDRKRKRERGGRRSRGRERNEEEPWNIISLLHPN